MLQLNARKWDEKTYWKPETRCLFSGLLRHLKQTSQQKTFGFGLIHWWMVWETFCFLIEWKLVWARTERCLVWEIAVWLILHSINPLLIHVRSGFRLLRTERKASSSGRFSFLKHRLIFTQYRESGGMLEKLRLWHWSNNSHHILDGWLCEARCSRLTVSWWSLSVCLFSGPWTMRTLMWQCNISTEFRGSSRDWCRLHQLE